MNGNESNKRTGGNSLTAENLKLSNRGIMSGSNSSGSTTGSGSDKGTSSSSCNPAVVTETTNSHATTSSGSGSGDDRSGSGSGSGRGSSGGIVAVDSRVPAMPPGGGITTPDTDPDRASMVAMIKSRRTLAAARSSHEGILILEEEARYRPREPWA